jgi:tetrahydromethanopterin S-methyltransferase subunit C
VTTGKVSAPASMVWGNDAVRLVFGLGRDAPPRLLAMTTGGNAGVDSADAAREASVQWDAGRIRITLPERYTARLLYIRPDSTMSETL